MKIKQSKGKSLYIGKLPRGCDLCIKGQKAVFFLGGACTKPGHCSWYCPISEERRSPSAIFIDEMPIRGDEDVLDEIRAIGAKGISFTGGEPAGAGSFDSIIRYLHLLKQEHGLNLHAHLYTTGDGITTSKLETLAKAGLDEIRFHPPPGQFETIGNALRIIPDVGAEVPAVPGEDGIAYMQSLARYLDGIGAAFLNMNEFELTSTNAQALARKGFTIKEGTLAAVNGSAEAARCILDWYKDEINGTLSLHFCPVVTKDKYQLRNRYRRRARNTLRNVEVPMDEGTVVFGRLISLDRATYVNDVISLKETFKVPGGWLSCNEEAFEVQFHPRVLDNPDAFDWLNARGAVLVEALPTRSRDECEFTPLSALDPF